MWEERAVIEGVNKSESSATPLAPQQGGVAAPINKTRSLLSRTQTGWFSFRFNRKTTPAERSADASQHFIGCSATPPCGDARRGILLASKFIHTFTDRPYSERTTANGRIPNRSLQCCIGTSLLVKTSCPRA